MMPIVQKVARLAARRPLAPAKGLAMAWAYDVCACTLAMWLAVKGRYAFAPNAEPEGAPLMAAGLFMVVCAVVFPLMSAHRPVWRFTDLRDVSRVLQALGLANLAFLPVWFLLDRLDGFPRTSLFLELPLAAILLTFPRVLTAAASGGGLRAVLRRENPERPAAILIGGHNALDAFLRESDKRPGGSPYRMRALITWEPGDHGRAIRDRRILGDIGDLARIVQGITQSEARAPDVILAETPARRDRLDRVVEDAARLGVELVRPHGSPGRNGLAPLDAADLLNRAPRRPDVSRLRSLITGKRVLVTGAGGTIGSELTRQVARLEPASLGLFDASEYNLYEIELEMRELGVNVTPFFGDVRDRPRVDEVMAACQPELVLHAAALKHVPLMEANPAEAVLTNVLGTMNVAEAARDAGAGGFVLISTDKAVQPTNVMGASKRAAELFVQALDAEGDPMRATAVRFGNVLGSSGSVTPLFERQIARGGPITVTHPDITRYFMTVQEASALVLQASALSRALPERGAGVFVLDMGEPVRIEDLARQLCRLRGVEPGVDIDIVHTGLRPGEKLHEDIFYDAEDVQSTDAEGVLVATAPMLPMETLQQMLARLIHAARRRDIPAIDAALQTLTPEFAARRLTGAPKDAA